MSRALAKRCRRILSGLRGAQQSRVMVWGFAASLLLVPASRVATRLSLDRSVTGIGDLASWARFLPPFLAGVVAYHVRGRFRPRGWVLCVAGGLVLALFRYRCGAIAAVLVPFVTVYAVLYFGFHPAVRLHHFARRGDFSYGTYLYAWPIQQTLVTYFQSRLTPWTLFAAAAPLSVLAGVASWYCVEQPLIRRRKRS